MSRTTYDMTTGHTTVWIAIRKLTPTERLRGLQVGDWRASFWFRGRV